MNNLPQTEQNQNKPKKLFVGGEKDTSRKIENTGPAHSTIHSSTGQKELTTVRFPSVYLN